MYIKDNGQWKKVTKKSVNLSSPSVIRSKRAAFERKKKTTAFKRWRRYQYTVIQKGLCYYCHRPIKGAWIQTANVVGGQSARAELHLEALK